MVRKPVDQQRERRVGRAPVLGHGEQIVEGHEVTADVFAFVLFSADPSMGAGQVSLAYEHVKVFGRGAWGGVVVADRFQMR